MPREDLIQKRAGYLQAVEKALVAGLSQWNLDIADEEPELLVEFYFYNQNQSIGRFSLSDLQIMMAYVNKVLAKRKDDTQRARSLYRAARCLNHVAGSIFFEQLYTALLGIVKTYESLYGDLVQAQQSVTSVGLLR